MAQLSICHAAGMVSGQRSAVGKCRTVSHYPACRSPRGNVCSSEALCTRQGARLSWHGNAKNASAEEGQQADPSDSDFFSSIPAPRFLLTVRWSNKGCLCGRVTEQHHEMAAPTSARGLLASLFAAAGVLAQTTTVSVYLPAYRGSDWEHLRGSIVGSVSDSILACGTRRGLIEP